MRASKSGGRGRTAQDVSDISSVSGGMRFSRASLLAGASFVALAGLSAPGVARAACIPSLQIIATPTSGPIHSNGGAITVTGSGTITGGPGGDGVDAVTCPITTLANQLGGAISGGTGAASTNQGGAGGAGVSNASKITTLTNSGRIADGGGGAGYGTSSRAGVGGAGGAGVSNAGTIRTLSNSGAISGGSGGRGVGGLLAPLRAAARAAWVWRTAGRSRR